MYGLLRNGRTSVDGAPHCWASSPGGSMSYSAKQVHIFSRIISIPSVFLRQAPVMQDVLMSTVQGNRFYSVCSLVATGSSTTTSVLKALVLGRSIFTLAPIGCCFTRFAFRQKDFGIVGTCHDLAVVHDRHLLHEFGIQHLAKNLHRLLPRWGDLCSRARNTVDVSLNLSPIFMSYLSGRATLNRRQHTSRRRRDASELCTAFHVEIAVAIRHNAFAMHQRLAAARKQNRGTNIWGCPILDDNLTACCSRLRKAERYHAPNSSKLYCT